MKWATGFENYNWKMAYGYTEHDYVFYHVKIDFLKLTLDITDRSFSHESPDIFVAKINGSGAGIKTEAFSKNDISNNLEFIFKDLLNDQKNIKIIFDEIFI